jgi:hypothetical protein
MTAPYNNEVRDTIGETDNGNCRQGLCLREEHMIDWHHNLFHCKAELHGDIL